jgi:divalent metal cation (Fe/Co/Zn/Cd) transporter
MKEKSGERTLLASVVLSAPGPVVLGLGLFLGKSSTQFADFIRRTAELVAIIVSWVIYRITHRNTEYDADYKLYLERIANYCVGVAMCLGGIAMLLMALLYPSQEKGNVILGLIIAVLGAITNSWFWVRYRMLSKETPNIILAAQSSLYRAKALVDICVTTALVVVAVSPNSSAAYYMDILGSVVIAVYLVVNGVLTMYSRVNKT